MRSQQPSPRRAFRQSRAHPEPPEQLDSKQDENQIEFREEARRVSPITLKVKIPMSENIGDEDRDGPADEYQISEICSASGEIAGEQTGSR